MKSDSKKSSMVKLYRSGKTLRQVAAEFDCSHQYVRQVLVERSVELRKRGASESYKNTKSARLTADIAKLADQGYDVRHIASELNCGLRLVRSVLKATGRSWAIKTNTLSEMEGHKYGMWLVKGYAGEGAWHCVCECGQQRTVNGKNLRSGRSKSCGCAPRGQA